MHLIIGTQTLANVPLRRIPGGYEAVLAGEALKRLLDATFGGASIEVLGGDLPAQGFDVTDIRMKGATTTVVLMRSGAKALH
jgi:hypothetical protein